MPQNLREQAPGVPSREMARVLDKLIHRHELYTEVDSKAGPSIPPPAPSRRGPRRQGQPCRRLLRSPARWSSRGADGCLVGSGSAESRPASGPPIREFGPTMFGGVVGLLRLDLDDVDFSQSGSLHHLLQATRWGEGERAWPSWLRGRCVQVGHHRVKDRREPRVLFSRAPSCKHRRPSGRSTRALPSRPQRRPSACSRSGRAPDRRSLLRQV